MRQRGVGEIGFSDDDRATANLSDQWGRVRRYWWLVVGIVVLSLVGAIAATLSTPTTHTGRASMIVASNDRSPDQDAVLVRGYADYFNHAAYQTKLAQDGTLDPGVSVGAVAAAGSPILLIDATAADAESAQSAATKVALAFRNDINRERADRNDAEVASLRRQLNRYVALVGENDLADSDRGVISALQDRIAQLQDDQVNKLQVLQLDGGVSQASPRLMMNIMFALVGGLVLGVLVALMMGRLSNRLLTRRDLADKLGLNTLIEFPRVGSADGARERDLRMRQLANILRAQMPERAVLAVTEPRQGAATAMVAHGLARQWAEQGSSTLLVSANGNPEASLSRSESTSYDPVDFPTDAAGVSLDSMLSPGPVAGMWVLSAGTSPDGVGREFKVDRIEELLAQAASLATFVVIEAPSVVDSPDAHVLCAAAGRTVLVVEAKVTRAPEAREAISVLERTNSGLLGAVLVHSPRVDDLDIDLRTGRTASGLQHAASKRE